MPTYKLEVDKERDAILRDVAQREHRPVLWQAEKLLADAIDRARVDLTTTPASAEQEGLNYGSA